MDNTSLIKIIADTVPVNSSKLATIVSCFSYKTFDTNETFLKSGKISDEYLYLEKGFLRSYLYDRDGNEVTLNFFPANSIVFEVASFFQRIPSQENIEALVPSSGWVLNYEKLNILFMKYLNSVNLAEQFLLKVLSHLKQERYH